MNAFYDLCSTNRGGLRFLNTYTEVEKTDRLRNYYKFLFVRHPFTRLMSAFRHKFLRPTGPYPAAQITINWISTHLRKGQKRTKKEGETDKVTFADFIEALVHPQFAHANNLHWETYGRLCSPCTIDYDFIGHQETFYDDAIFLLKHELKLDPWIPAKQIHWTKTTSMGTREAFSQLPTKVLEMVKKRYHDDAAMFGYEWEK